VVYGCTTAPETHLRQTIPTPDREEVQRRREGQGPGEGLGVTTRASQKAHDKDAEDNKVTCLDFGTDRHREWKDHGAVSEISVTSMTTLHLRRKTRSAGKRSSTGAL
jgi:hypothetical protein